MMFSQPVDISTDAQQAGLPLDLLTPGHTPQGGDGLELLLDMATRGDIDPWDVDIIQVAEAYSSAMQDATADLDHTQKVAETDESKLKRLGKMLLYLAILLRMKSDLLRGEDPFRPVLEDADFSELPPEDPEWGTSFDDWDGFHSGHTDEADASEHPQAQDWGIPALAGMSLPKSPFDILKAALVRRTSAKQPRVRRVTLEDLIKELQRYDDIEETLQQKAQLVKSQDRRQKVRDYSQLSTEAIKEMAHEEFHEEVILQVLATLKHHWLSIGVTTPTLDELSHETQTHTVSPPASRSWQTSVEELANLSQEDRLTTYLSLLFLYTREHIDLHQPTWYEDTLMIGPWDKDLSQT
jgi:segregation and condensation protein A